MYIYQRHDGRYEVSEKTSAKLPRELSLAIIQQNSFPTYEAAYAWMTNAGGKAA